MEPLKTSLVSEEQSSTEIDDRHYSLQGRLCLNATKYLLIFFMQQMFMVIASLEDYVRSHDRLEIK